MTTKITTNPDGTATVDGWACIAPYLYVKPKLETKPGGEFTVWFEWHDTRQPLDRPTSFGISTGNRRDLATRLMIATLAGAIHSEARVLKDVDGREYVSAKCAVMGKYLNADLKRLGF